MLGPGLSVRGGITSVEKLILGNLPGHIEATHVATMAGDGRASKLWAFLTAVLTTKALLRKGVDIAHIHFASRTSSIRKMLLCQMVLRAGVGVVMHAHGGAYADYWNQMGAREKRRTLAVLSNVSALIVLGETWRAFFSGIGVPSDRIIVLPNPVTLPCQLPERIATARVVLVYLGLIDAKKGAFDLVEAVTGLPLGVRDRLKVVVAGNGEGDRLRKLVYQAGLGEIVEVRGWIDAQERDELLARADAFVLPSYFEAMPMAVLEAMAWGLPVICTAVGSIPEILVDGKNGVLVAPGDICAISSAIQRMVEDEAWRRTLGVAARKAVEPFATEHYMRALCSIYESVVDFTGPRYNLDLPDQSRVEG